MSRHQAFLLCAFPALSTVLLASDGKAPAAPAGSLATDIENERGVPALFSWGDVNGDGRLDLAAVSGQGTLQLLANVGDGRFEDVTERAGLAGVVNAALALWADYDGDLRLDLFVGAREGASRLFHNEGGLFVDMSAGSGLLVEGAVQFAHWLDHDGDGRLDLHVVTSERLIAEEVAEVFPDLVVYDEEGLPFTVKYHLLSSMLLNELKRLAGRYDAQSERLHGLETRFAALESRASQASLPATSSADSR